MWTGIRHANTLLYEPLAHWTAKKPTRLIHSGCSRLRCRLVPGLSAGEKDDSQAALAEADDGTDATFGAFAFTGESGAQSVTLAQEA
eukprot:SAG31_NODE_32156_length_359_cov_0.923077_1_plen_86_part_01